MNKSEYIEEYKGYFWSYPKDKYDSVEDFVSKNIYILDNEEKIAFAGAFIDSEYYTNQYDRTILSFTLNNDKNLNKFVFIKSTEFICNYISYNQNRISENKTTSLEFHHGLKSFEDMEKMYKMDALEFMLENSTIIFICLPQPKNIKEFLENKLLINLEENND